MTAAACLRLKATDFLSGQNVSLRIPSRPAGGSPLLFHSPSLPIPPGFPQSNRLCPSGLKPPLQTAKSLQSCPTLCDPIDGFSDWPQANPQPMFAGRVKAPLPSSCFFSPLFDTSGLCYCPPQLEGGALRPTLPSSSGESLRDSLSTSQLLGLFPSTPKRHLTCDPWKFHS